MTYIIIGVFIRQSFKNDVLVNYNVLVIILLLFCITDTMLSMTCATSHL